MDVIPLAYKKDMVFEPNTEFTLPNVRKIILNAFIRQYGIPNWNALDQNKLTNAYGKIASDTQIPSILIVSILNRFSSEIEKFQQFFATHTIHYTPENRLRKAQVYLYKMYRMLPIFNYTRAVFNLNSLHALCARLNFWPQLTTLLALSLYITEHLDKAIPKNGKISINNILFIFSCSAYAFYRTKKKIELSKYLTP